MQPNELASDGTGVINETVSSVLARKNLHNPPPCSTLEVYNKTPIFIPVYIKEYVVESFMRKLSGSSGPGVIDSEALQGWLLKPREYTKILRTSVEIFSV